MLLMKRRLSIQTPKVLAQDHSDNETQKLDWKEFLETKKKKERNVAPTASYCQISEKYFPHKFRQSRVASSHFPLFPSNCMILAVREGVIL